MAVDTAERNALSEAYTTVVVTVTTERTVGVAVVETPPDDVGGGGGALVLERLGDDDADGVALTVGVDVAVARADVVETLLVDGGGCTVDELVDDVATVVVVDALTIVGDAVED